MFNKILIANRGEIALRILRACKELGIKTVGIYSAIDANLLHLKYADEIICIGGAEPKDSYANMQCILSAAETAKVDAIHPGYGFLAENAEFAELVQKSGYIFVGPNPESIRLMADKVTGINTMRELGVPCVQNSKQTLHDLPQQNIEIAREIGYPLILKYAGGGGHGRGMRVVHTEASLLNAIYVAHAEATAIFGDSALYMEHYLENPRHIEFQILADGQGNAINLGARDCSMQIKHQKIVEESPAIGINKETLQKMGEICVKACLALQYRGLGTLEFLYQDGQFYFLEMNTRIQVEHPVTECITGIDLVKEQLKIAAGENLKIKQNDVKIHGHALECRIYAEDPKTLKRTQGTVKIFHAPGGPGIRVDSHLYNNYTIPDLYDPLLAKIIAFGSSREVAIRRMSHALDELVIEGIVTNVPLLQSIMIDSNFINGERSVHYLEKRLAPDFSGRTHHG